MIGKVLTIAFVLGLATALPTTNLGTLRDLKHSALNGRLGIYHGKNTTIADHNYLVGIVQNDNFICSGSIISESFVLTIADCFYGISRSSIKVVAGSSNGTTGTSFIVQKIITHQNYSFDSGAYNYALLKIKGKFTFGTDVGNVTLPSASPKNETALVAVGYGYTSQSVLSGNGTLKEGTMKYLSVADCKSYYAAFEIQWDSTMACAYNKRKVTMCEFDFGDPFTKGTVLYGMMSTFAAIGFCTSSAMPVIIVDVYTAVDWINEYI